MGGLRHSEKRLRLHAEVEFRLQRARAHSLHRSRQRRRFTRACRRLEASSQSLRHRSMPPGDPPEPLTQPLLTRFILHQGWMTRSPFFPATPFVPSSEQEVNYPNSLPYLRGTFRLGGGFRIPLLIR